MRVLIGSAGGYTGQYLVDYFIDRLSCEVYAFDLNELSYSHFRCRDHFFKAPPIKDEKIFLEWLVQIVGEHGIKLYIPTLSKEFEVVSKWAEWLRNKLGCFFLVSPAKTISLFRDKSVYYPVLQAAGIDVPRIVTSTDEETFPLFYKETSSSGSRNAHVIRNKGDLEAALSEDDGMCVEYIEGQEVTVDCFVSPEGQLLSYNSRTREKTLGGMAVICRNHQDSRIDPIVKKIVNQFSFAGCINMQFILSERRVVLIDLNTRFPSGGLPLTVESGIKVPELMLCYAECGTPDKSLYENDGKNRVMYRHFMQYYEILS